MNEVLLFGRHNCKGTLNLRKFFDRIKVQHLYIESSSRGEKIPECAYSWRGDYIFSYRSFYILPKIILNNAKEAAINFHPGTPKYPGTGCVNFALYENSKEFGVTAHLMDNKVDSGRILKVTKFPIQSKDNLQSILARTHIELEKLALSFLATLFNEGSGYVSRQKELMKSVHWSGNARTLKELDDLKHIDVNLSKAELNRIIRATYIDGYPPFIELYGHRFYLDKAH